MTRNYGGCAANIAYALKLLGGEPVVTGAVGTDGSDYLYRFEQLEIETSVAKFNDVFTAQCFVTTDKTGSQLATFNPGAMSRAHEAPFPEGEIGLALVAPDGKEAVIQRMNECFSRNIPVVFDIGQAISILSGDEIRELISKIDAAEVAGISFGGQMHGLVILDENDKVIRPAILWNDGRTTKECEYLNNTIGKGKLTEYTANIALSLIHI